MISLDEVPWSALHHAYGTAEDVPRQLRKLRVASTCGDALHELFGNIWHQGTVYEATSFAVPFLVELAIDESTPNPVGILNLLEAIAHGSSYLDVHEPFFREMKVEAFGDPGTPKYENARDQELVCVEKSRSAVLAAFDEFLNLAKRPGDIAYAAIAVLVRLNTRQQQVLAIISDLRATESRDLYRAGLLILLGHLAIIDDSIMKTLNESAASGEQLERLAAGLAACRFTKDDLSGPLRNAIVEALCTSDVAWLFSKLPWDAGESIDTALLRQRPRSETEEAIGLLFERLERVESVKESIYRLLDLLFANRPTGREFTSKEQLSSDQLRLLKAMLDQFDNHGMHLNVSLMQYGLPDSRRALRSLVTGTAYTKLDDLYPDIAFADNPFRPRRIKRLKKGDRIHSRYFGLGTITSVERERYYTSIQVDFDEEGPHTLSLDHSLKRFLIDLGCYYLIALFVKKQS